MPESSAIALTFINTRLCRFRTKQTHSSEAQGFVRSAACHHTACVMTCAKAKASSAISLYSFVQRSWFQLCRVASSPVQPFEASQYLQCNVQIMFQRCEVSVAKADTPPWHS